MSRWAEERAVLCRHALRKHGALSPLAAWELAEWLGPCVEVRQRHGGCALFQPRRNGSARIHLPLLADERREAGLLLEELAHYLCRAHYPAPPWLDRAAASRAALTLDQLREQDEEGEARAFMDAFLLSREAVIHIGDNRDALELLWETGLDWETLERRHRRLRIAPPLPFEPPHWAAWSRYRVTYAGKPVPRFRIVPLESGERLYEVAGDARRFAEQRWEIHADLAALLPHEFALKYSSDRHSGWENVGMHWSEFMPEVRRS